MVEEVEVASCAKVNVREFEGVVPIHYLCVLDKYFEHVEGVPYQLVHEMG